MYPISKVNEEQLEKIKVNDEIVHIKNRLPGEERLAQLAEEAAELAQAALKLRRAIGNTNPTPVSVSAARDNLIEEYADTILCIRAILDNNEIALGNDIAAVKARRWADSLEAAAH